MLDLPLTYGLGWALAHFVWQAALIALLLAAALPLLRGPRERYAAACSAMAAMVTAFAATWVWSVPQAAALPVREELFTALDASNAQAAGLIVQPNTFESALPWVVTLWAAGALLVGLYHLGGWFAVQRLRRVGVSAAPPEWRRRLQRLACRMAVSRPVELLESSLTEGPMVIGVLRPAILFPAGLLSGLPVSQLEAILLHELAHLRRLDYLVNLVQTVLESLLFYHPGVWWVSKLMRVERESCCDQSVVEVQGDAGEYAAALLTLEERRCFGPEPAPAATGGMLINRIRRLLGQPEEPRSAAGLVLSMGLLLAVFCAIAIAQQTDSQKSQHQQWLDEDAVYIISAEERAAFERLQADQERDRFIEQFWEKRDPTPGTPVNERKTEHYRRIEYAQRRWGSAGAPGWKTDRGQVYIVYGPPDEIEAHPSGGSAARLAFSSSDPFEAWGYRRLEGIGHDILLLFVDADESGDYRLIGDHAALNLK
jgi:GWxTD domain-containing protein